MSYLALKNLSKSFEDNKVLENISLGIERGETLVLLGVSGSGKTTLLRLIAGFESADTGSIKLASQRIDGLPPERRNFGMMFQHYALFPHMTVAQNVAFGLESRGRRKSEVDAAVDKALALVELEALGGRSVGAISGGQQQRVALARALAPEPDVLLLDEPLSNLDPELRERTRRELSETLLRIGITAVWVTHEQEEAFDVGTRVAVLDQGRLQQVGSPETLYRAPETPFVASFIGQASVLPARLAAPDGNMARAIVSHDGDRPIELPCRVVGECAEGALLDVYVRPESWSVVDAGAVSAVSETAGIEGHVLGRRFLGRENLVRVELSIGSIEYVDEADRGPGEAVHLAFRRDGVVPTAFPARQPDRASKARRETRGSE